MDRSERRQAKKLKNTRRFMPSRDVVPIVGPVRGIIYRNEVHRQTYNRVSRKTERDIRGGSDTVLMVFPDLQEG